MSSKPPKPPNSSLRKTAILNSTMHAPTNLDESLPIPAPWAAYFDEQRTVTCPTRRTSFHVYTAGTTGPVVLCLHGGGYTGLTWALVAQQLKSHCRVIAPDLRGHGHTESDDADTDLSAATLADDVVAIYDRLFGDTSGDSLDSLVPLEGRNLEAQLSHTSSIKIQSPPPTILVGHSMGGAIAVKAAASGGITSLAGVVVIDVVEGTALESLPHMQEVLNRRPGRFPSLVDAVKWALASGMSRNAEATSISLPSQLVYTQGHQGNDTAAAEAGRPSSPAGAITPSSSLVGGTSLEAIPEDSSSGLEEENSSKAAAVEVMMATAGSGGGFTSLDLEQQQQQEIPSIDEDTDMSVDGIGNTPVSIPVVPATVSEVSLPGWRWRTNLSASVQYWEGWYRGLSKEFLGVKVPKVLILAGTDRLDKDLMIGQMQGQFQLVVLPQAGHAVHEDLPDKTVEVISTFIKRFKIGG